MFGNSDNGDDENSDDSNTYTTYTEYVVYDRYHNEIGRYDTPEEAELVENQNVGAYIETEEAVREETQDEGEDELEVVESWNDTDDFHSMPESDDAGVEVLDEDDGSNDGYAFWREDRPDSSAADGGGQRHRWTLGDHNVRHDVDTEALKAAAEDINGVNPGLAAALEEAANQVSSAEVSGFECPVCGLNHGHSDAKHDVRSDTSGFGVTDEFADFMEWCPYCHCGVNELAMLIDFYNHIDMDVFSDNESFERVSEIRNDMLIEICKQIRESEEDSRQQTLSVDMAVRDLGYMTVSPELDSHIEAFYDLWSDIKDAANGAPIASSTRSSINGVREDLNEKFGY